MGGPWSPPAALYVNADIVTLEDHQPHATALATCGDRIAAVGDTQQCQAILERLGAHEIDEVDLGGACIVPGFIDTHLHPIGVLYFDMNADLRGIKSIRALQDTLRAAAARLPQGEWLVGLQLEDADLAERRLPTRVELDAACGDQPVVVLKHDAHSATANSAALAAAGIVVGGASDAPVESTSVLHAMECCVTREGFEPQQGLTPLEALRLFTRDAAYIQFEENEKGTLAAGKRADLVVLSANPLEVDCRRIASIRVERTVAGGRLTYERGS